MTDAPGTLYAVAVLEHVGGRLGWHVLLKTKDEAEAEALKVSIEADGVRCRVERFPPEKG